MDPSVLNLRYRELQQYVGWTADDARRVASLLSSVEPHFPALVEDFYAEIERHPAARRVVDGGAEQIHRLMGTLQVWLRQLFSGRYDSDYVSQRWRVGKRHVEIGLEQTFTNAALSRLRTGLIAKIDAEPTTIQALHKLLDLDLAIIEDAYQAEYMDRVRRVEKERTELIKARSDAAFGALLDTAPCMIVVVKPSWSIRYFSRFAEELTGFEAKEVVSGHFLELFVPAEAHERVAAVLLDVLNGKPARSFEYRVLCKHGAVRSMLWNAEKLVDSEGRPHVLAVGQDISELKQAQEAALQSARLAAIGQMTAGLAHESGNALARMQMSLDALATDLGDRPELMEQVHTSQTAVEQLRKLLDEVRGYAAPLRLQREPLSIALAWRQAWDNLAMLRQGKSARLVEQIEDVGLECSIDLFRMEQVFRNLLENSLAACPASAVVKIRCSPSMLGGKPALEIRVSDNGPGLSPEQRARVFEPFFTTKSKGTGLGLAIAKRIVEAHGGHIEVGPNRPGAAFYLTMPLPTP